MSEITSMDMANVMGSFISTELDAFENLHNELQEKDNEIERLEKENKDLKSSNIYLSKTCDRYKMELERLNENNQAMQEEVCKVWEERDNAYRRILDAVDNLETPYFRECKQQCKDVIDILKGSDKE